MVSIAINASAEHKCTIIPMPVSVIEKQGNFQLSRQTYILVDDKSLKEDAIIFNKFLEQTWGIQLTIENFKQNSGNFIELKRGVFPRLKGRKEAYALSITNNSITIEAEEDGMLHGLMSLYQLIPPSQDLKKGCKINCMQILDYPRFGYRGMHLDVGRHFFGIDFIKKYLDYMVLYKMNTFHWHLTEDQGWRIEIKKYPRLTQIGGFRDGTIIGHYPGTGFDSTRYGGYYTQEQIREIVRYANERHITIIPEIELPGHSSAALAAYPYLGCTGGPYKVQGTWGVFDDVYCAGKDSTFQFLEDVLDEVMALFPSKYIHIGGDECPKTSWEKCPFCQKRMKDNHLKDTHALQSYFIQRIEKYINSKGRKIIGWDEILEGGLAQNATVMSWRGTEGGIAAARLHHQVIMTPGDNCYFDHAQSKHEDSLNIGGYLPLENVYNYDPIPGSLLPSEKKYIIGAQGNVWTEYMAYPSKVEYMVFPRITALSETLWTPLRKKDYHNYLSRLKNEMRRYDKLGIHYSTAAFEMQTEITPGNDGKSLLWKLTPGDQDFTIFAGKEGKLQPIEAGEPLRINQSGKYTANQIRKEDGKIIQSISELFSFNLATGSSISLKDDPDPSYPGNHGANGLINGISAGNKGLNSSEWLGWNGQALNATLTFKEEKTITKIVLGLLVNKGSWIYPPKEISIAYLDQDNKWHVIAQKKTYNMQQSLEEQKVSLEFAPIQTQSIKIIASNYGKIPEGEEGAGNPAWLFVDEIAAY